MKVFFCSLNRYVDNICKNPTEEKYRKIKVGNKVFQVCHWTASAPVARKMAVLFLNIVSSLADLRRRFAVWRAVESSYSLWDSLV